MSPQPLSRGWRKLSLTTHITASVSWLGAVAAFLALAIAGLTSQNAQIVRAAYIATDLITWWVIVPLSFASLVTGIIQSQVSLWGVFRHYWVVAKLLLNVAATILLLLHTRPISFMAGMAERTTLSSTDLRPLRIQLIADAGAALIALLIATTLSVYKPAGLTPYGRRKLEEKGTAAAVTSARVGTPLWVKVGWTTVAVLVILFLIRHLVGGGLHRH